MFLSQNAQEYLASITTNPPEGKRSWEDATRNLNKHRDHLIFGPEDLNQLASSLRCIRPNSFATLLPGSLMRTSCVQYTLCESILYHCTCTDCSLPKTVTPCVNEYVTSVTSSARAVQPPPRNSLEIVIDSINAIKPKNALRNTFSIRRPLNNMVMFRL